MKQKINLMILITLFTSELFSIDDQQEYALVIKPIVDIIGQPLPDLSFYNNIPFSPVNKKDQFSCIRLHQLLFNEIVKVIEKQQDELIIELPWTFFQQAGNSIKKNKFRALKKNFILFSQLKKFNVDFNKIPKSINFNEPNSLNLTNVVTLKAPFKDPKTDKIYSAGTRFVYDTQDDKNYNVFIFNPINHHFNVCSLSKKFCIQNNYDNAKKVANFVKTLKKWANLKKGFIPYVWGGCSFNSIQNDTNFIDLKKKHYRKNVHFYDYPNSKFESKSGFDCTGLILRAAQICGLPYYFKNSTTVNQNLKTLDKDEDIQNGDLIWFSGHVIAISNVEKNLMIEATDYSSGYGKVHEIEISKIFKDIKNYDDLKKAFLQKKALKRLNKKGNVFQDITTFKILKISSIWN